MQYSTMAFVLALLAILSLISSLDWLAVVFFAMALALWYYDRISPVVPQKTHSAKHHSPSSPQPQQIVIVQKGDGGVSKALAEEIVKHEVLTKARKR